MAIDPAIPLAVKPPPIENPLNVYGQVLGLQAAQQQMQQGQALEEERRLRIAEQQRQQAGRSALTTILNSPDAYDPETKRVVPERVADALGKRGFTDLAEAWLKQTVGNREQLDKWHASARAHADQTLETIGALAAKAQSSTEFDAGVAAAAANSIIDQPAAEKFIAEADAAGPDGWKAFAQKYSNLAPSVRSATLAAQGKLQEPMKLGSGESVVIPGTGKTVVSNAPKKTFQSENVTLDGKPNQRVGFDPGTNTYWKDGQEVTARVTSNPPASIQVQNTIAAGTSAANVDASRPDPKTANVPDRQTGMTPNAMYQGAVEFALTGKMPNLGFGQSPRAMAIRTAIPNKAAALAASAGVDLPTVQAEYRANATALNKLLPQAKATAGFANTATDNLELALQQSGDVARSGSKLANRYLQWVQGELTPAKGLTKFETYVYTAAREYAKVTSGSAASAAGLTDSAQKEASKLLNTAQSPEAFQAAVEAMKADMANVITNQSKTLAGISSTIANFFSAVNGGGPVSTSAPAVEVWERDASGKLVKKTKGGA